MIRKAILNDASRIAEINVSSWRFAYKDFVSEEVLYKDTLVRDRILVVKDWISKNNDYVYVFEDDNNKIVKGMMGIGTCNDEDKPDSFELHFLYVEPEFSRSGIGSQMINFFETRGLELGKKEFVIWVLEENNIGKSFYEKHNYVADGKSKIYQRLNKKEMRYIKNEENSRRLYR